MAVIIAAVVNWKALGVTDSGVTQYIRKGSQPQRTPNTIPIYTTMTKRKCSAYLPNHHQTVFSKTASVKIVLFFVTYPAKLK